MDKIKGAVIVLLAALSAIFMSGCKDNKIPDNPEGPVPGVQERKAPLYWSVYEYCWEKEKQGDKTIDISQAQWDRIINWVSKELKPYGYDMICTDGFISMLSEEDHGYMTRYGSITLRELVAKCRAKGLKLGVYDNPLWVHGPLTTKVQGRDDVTFGDLLYDSAKDNIVNASAKEDKWFTWIIATHDGAREYIDGFFKHYSEMGVKYIRMDFLSWYEDGKDRNMGTVGRGYGRKAYELALKYISESAQKYGVFTSLVMPHLNQGAALEKVYGDMVRIVADTGDGGWNHFSDHDRGRSYGTWPNCMNQFDGFVYWSKITGRGKVIADGDFLRMSKFSTDEEKESVVSLQLMAGGPVTPSDMYNNENISEDIRFYKNMEMLALNKDGFVGKPLATSLIDKKNQIWYGQMSDGDWIVGLFNRENVTESRSVKLSELGIAGKMKVRDLWKHAEEGETDVIKANLKPHACKIVRLSYTGFEIPEDPVEEVDPGEEGDQLYLIGGVGHEYKDLEHAVKMTKDGDVYTYTGLFSEKKYENGLRTANSNEGFRFCCHKGGNDYGDCWYKAQDNKLVYKEEAEDNNIIVNEGEGYYTITVNLTDKNNPTYSVVRIAPYFLGGDDEEFIQLEAKANCPGVYTKTVNAEDNSTNKRGFKFVATNDFSDADSYFATVQDAPVWSQGVNVGKVNGAGYKWNTSSTVTSFNRLYVELDTKNYTMKAWPLGVYLVGTASSKGWDQTIAGRECFTPDYTRENTLVYDGHLGADRLKLRTDGHAIEAGFWDAQYFIYAASNDVAVNSGNSDGNTPLGAVCNANGNDNQWIIAEAGEYTITLVLGDNATINFKKKPGQQEPGQQE